MDTNLTMMVSTILELTLGILQQLVANSFCTKVSSGGSLLPLATAIAAVCFLCMLWLLIS